MPLVTLVAIAADNATFGEITDNGHCVSLIKACVDFVQKMSSTPNLPLVTS